MKKREVARGSRSTKPAAAAARSTHPPSPTGHRSGKALAPRFGIDEGNLAVRREFIRLGETDRKTLASLESWAATVALDIAREFYDWQFSFKPTLKFFEAFAAAHDLPLSAVRKRLESSQAGYIHSIFSNAAQKWGVEHFENRLNVGWVHDQINLPFKWYIGSYAEMQRLVRIYLRRDHKGATPELAEDAIVKVFNYDMQAIGESFLLSTLESMGLDIQAIEESEDGDKTESLVQVKEAIQILNSRCAALAEGRLSDPVFDTKAPCAGSFGEAFARIRENFRSSLLNISQCADTLSASAEELTAVSQLMASNAEETSVQANVVSSASDDVSGRVSLVATSSEEMLGAIHEISESAHGSAAVARDAVTAAQSAHETVQRLGDSSLDIGKVIKAISLIAKQTNLLAINASIEAAHAGLAGKGFAVVASEVKELAKDTARATADIGQKIDAIQKDTHSAVQAIGQIRNVIQEVNAISDSIAAAVEEQSAITNQISRNASEAAQSTVQIAQNIAGVATAAHDTTRGAAETQIAARALSEMAVELQNLVGRFHL